MRIELSRIVRGVKVTVYGSHFDGDESVGIPVGPEEIGATRDDDGTEFQLTDEELEQFQLELSRAYYEQE